MSWESTVVYYKTINTVAKEQLGGLHSAKCIINSVDFHEIEKCQQKGEWLRSAAILAGAARKLESAGADFFLICSNTMHKVADAVQAAVKIPLLHIADVTAEELIREGIRRVGLIGTRYTMEQDFYKSRIAARGIEVMVPDVGERHFLNDIIFNELCLGVTNNSSRKGILRIIKRLGDTGARGIILGCTEIGMLIKQSDTDLPLFDTGLIHAGKAAQYAISESFPPNEYPAK